ncbi:MAG: hypothetical protein ACLUKN_14650 [Bacilli bacterium]
MRSEFERQNSDDSDCASGLLPISEARKMRSSATGSSQSARGSGFFGEKTFELPLSQIEDFCHGRCFLKLGAYLQYSKVLSDLGKVEGLDCFF